MVATVAAKSMASTANSAPSAVYSAASGSRRTTWSTAGWISLTTTTHAAPQISENSGQT